MIIPIIVLLAVFILIAARNFLKAKIAIWQIMLGGAVIVLICGQISPSDAIKSINIDVMLFLFGMFVVGQALYDSGYLSHLSYNFFNRAKSIDQLLLFVIFGAGIASAILMNDTLAIIGTPVVLLLAMRHKIHAKPLLLALCFAVTIGSVMSPIGNPQNLLIAINGEMKNPFVSFLKYLAIPTVINLFVTFIFLKLCFKEHFKNNPLTHSQEPIRDHNLALLSKISLIMILALIVVKVCLVFMGFDFRLTYIALASMAPILIFSRKRFRILRDIDWHTLIFFVAMFVLMESVWDAGFFQNIIGGASITTIPMIFLVSIVVSQFISNVPLVALYLPMLVSAGVGVKEMVALAAGSTIAGNLLILGAASNVIVIQNAEKRQNETITFLEFAKIGIPLTIINTLVYMLFFLVL